MIRLWLEEIGSMFAVAVSIGIVIAFAAIGCAMNKRDSYTAHNVQGFRAPIVLHTSHDN